MKRWTVRILVCLILGAITTVAVAWGFIAIDQRLESVRVPLTDDEQNLLMRRHLEQSLCHTPTWVSQGWSPEDIQWGKMKNTTALVRIGKGYRESRLIAFVAFTCKQGYFEFGGTDFLEICNVQVGMPLVSFADYRCDLEVNQFSTLMVPIWPGFVIDTLFYAAIWGGVWFGCVGGKRFIRSKRGRCPRCSYNLRGQLAEGCPECGWNREAI